jgi:hypothetical protein
MSIVGGVVNDPKAELPRHQTREDLEEMRMYSREGDRVVARKRYIVVQPR